MLSMLLLGLHIGALVLFAMKWVKASKKEVGKALFIGSDLNPVYVVYTLFVANFIGIAFARTLHYQFYSWYFHSFPVILWLTKIPIPLRIVLVLMLEYAFNVFPATPLSSLVLQISHFVTLFAVWNNDVPQIRRQRHQKDQ